MFEKSYNSLLYSLFVDLQCVNNNLLPIDPLEVLKFIRCLKADDIWAVIRGNKSQLSSVTTGTIPQFSEKQDMYKTIKIIIDSENPSLIYADIGYYLCGNGAKKIALRKYGENHYNLAAQLGLTFTAPPGVIVVKITDLGLAFYLQENDEIRDEIIKRLSLRIPIIQQLLFRAEQGDVQIMDFLAQYLSYSTCLRRRSNMHTILKWIKSISDEPLLEILNNIRG